MAVGITENLVMMFFITWLACLVITWTYLRPIESWFIAFIKAAVPFVFFSFFYDGSWNFGDDLAYGSVGAKMMAAHYTPFSVFESKKALQKVIFETGSPQFFYGWWNFFLQWLFGPHYYMGVFMNVVLTCLTGLFFDRALREADFSPAYRRLYGVFFLLHWDVVAWSSLINLKDIVIMSLTALCLYSFMRIFKRFQIRHLIYIGVAFSLMLGIRFFVPGLLMICAGLWVFFHWKSRMKYVLIGIFAAVGLVIMPFSPGEFVAILRLKSFPVGLIRFTLTPLPWKIDDLYSFLLVPSYYHLILLIPGILGAVSLWKRNAQCKFLLTYLGFIFILHAIVFSQAQGPRQRVQALFLIAWTQFHFIWVMIQELIKRQTRGSATFQPVTAPGLVKSPEGVL